MSKDDRKISEKQASDNFFSKNKALIQKKAEELSEKREEKFPPTMINLGLNF